MRTDMSDICLDIDEKKGEIFKNFLDCIPGIRFIIALIMASKRVGEEKEKLDLFGG